MFPPANPYPIGACWRLLQILRSLAYQLELLEQPALEDLVDPFPWSGEDAGDHPIAFDDLILENDTMRANSQTVKTFQFIGERSDVYPVNAVKSAPLFHCVWIHLINL